MSIEKLGFLNPTICQVFLADISKVSTYDLSYDNGLATIVLNDNESFQEIYATPGKTTFEEIQQDDPAGPYYNQKLEFLYPGENYDSISKLANLEYARLIVVMRYSSDVYKVFGDPKNPCMMKFGYSTEKGGRVVTITRKSPIVAESYLP